MDELQLEYEKRWIGTRIQFYHIIVVKITRNEITISKNVHASISKTCPAIIQYGMCNYILFSKNNKTEKKDKETLKSWQIKIM